ncbi:MAG TPA: hypothetical protein VF939_20220 [Puia sp.]
MKKVKIMLTAITTLAIVGGALAFKARKFHLHTFYTTTAHGTLCDFTTSLFLTTNRGGVTTLYTDAFRAPAPCITKVVACN